MRASDLAKQFNMQPHDEGGLFFALDAVPATGTAPGQRDSSGKIYYYLGPNDKSMFHQIDCDEYWCYHAGTSIEIWMIDPSGKLTIKKCGAEKGADPLLFFPKGTIFGARHGANRSDGTFLSCITVPQFCYESSKLFTKEEIIAEYPAILDFFRFPRF